MSINYIISKLYHSEMGREKLKKLREMIEKNSYLSEKTLYLDQALRFILIEMLDDVYVEIETNDNVVEVEFIDDKKIKIIGGQSLDKMTLIDELISEGCLLAVLKKCQMDISFADKAMEMNLWLQATDMGDGLASYLIWNFFGIAEMLETLNAIDKNPNQYKNMQDAFSYLQLSHEQGFIGASLLLAYIYDPSANSDFLIKFPHLIKEIDYISVIENIKSKLSTDEIARKDKAITYLKQALEKSEMNVVLSDRFANNSDTTREMEMFSRCKELCYDYLQKLGVQLSTVKLTEEHLQSPPQYRFSVGYDRPYKVFSSFLLSSYEENQDKLKQAETMELGAIRSFWKTKVKEMTSEHASPARKL